MPSSSSLSPDERDGLLGRFLVASRRSEIVALINSACLEGDLGPVVAGELCEAYDAEIGFVRSGQVRDGGSRQHADEQHVDTGRGQTGDHRGFEHLAGSATVAADALPRATVLELLSGGPALHALAGR